MNRKRRRRRARLRRVLLAGPPLLVVTAYLVGTRLPPIARLEAAGVFPVSAETVWAILTDLDDMPAWRADLSALERLPERDGAVRWLEVGRRGRIAYQRVEAEQPRRLVVQEERGDRGARWVYRIVPNDQGVTVSVSVERPVPSPLGRVLAVLVAPGRSVLDGLVSDLAARLALRRREVVAGGGGGGRGGGR